MNAQVLAGILVDMRAGSGGDLPHLAVLEWADAIEAALAAPKEARSFPERFACNGPEGTFWTDDSALANKLIAATFDRDEWTVTDTNPPGGVSE